MNSIRKLQLSPLLVMGVLLACSLLVARWGLDAYTAGGCVAVVGLTALLVEPSDASGRTWGGRLQAQAGRFGQHDGPAILREMAIRKGIHFAGAQDIMPRDVALQWGQNFRLAMDAQPTLSTVESSGIPAYLTMYVDPAVVDVLFAPMRAAEILGEQKKGTWLDNTMMFLYVEHTGETSSYGDYSEDGSSGANVNFPQRQSYHYQTWTQWGELELERMGLARLDWVSQKNIASALALNKFQNNSYFFGVAGLENYGLLNDPFLSAPLSPTAAWSTSAADVIYDDVLRMFRQLQVQSLGVVEKSDKMTLVMSPTTEVSMLNTNPPYDSQTAESLIKKGFPNLTIKNAVEYNNPTGAGQFVQLIVDSVDGQKTATCAFTEKMRAHAIVRGSSNFKQKKSQGTWGTVVFQPFAITSMVGIT